MAIIAIGGNLPSQSAGVVAAIVAAIRDISQCMGGIISVSRFFRTPAFPAGSGPDFTNAVICVKTGLSATDCLAALHRIEADHGRERNARWDARTLDLDLLSLDQMVLPDPATQTKWRHLAPEQQAHMAPDQLILPHPRLQDRGFVLIPFADIAPDWCHPVTGKTVAEMVQALPEAEKAPIWPI